MATSSFSALWELHELLYARMHFNPSFTAEDVMHRYNQFGGVPRHVFVSEKGFIKP